MFHKIEKHDPEPRKIALVVQYPHSCGVKVMHYVHVSSRNMNDCTEPESCEHQKSSYIISQMTDQSKRRWSSLGSPHKNPYEN